jgi:hypothetical protein
MATNPTIQFKRKITSGTPSTLSIGEPAVNTADNQLFIGVNSSAIKWVGAEIENSSTNGTTWSSDLKLATKKAIGDYFAPLSGGTFTGVVSFGQGSTAAGEIRLLEDTDDGSNYSAFRGSARSANITYVMPTTDPTSGQVLSASAPSSNVSTLSWIDSGSASTIAVTDDDATTTLYPMFSTVTTGSTITKIDSDGMTYNASTDSLTIPGDLAVNGADITTTSTGTATLFNTNATTVNMAGAGTTVSIGATTGSTSIRNPVISLGSTTASISTPNGTTNHLTLVPKGDVIISPTSQTMPLNGGTLPSLTVNNDYLGTFDFVGGDIYLGTKSTDDLTPVVTQVNIIWEGSGDDGNETTLTVANPTGDRTITLPDATGTVALVAGSDTQVLFNDGGSALGGDAGLTYNKSTDSLTITGDLAVNGADITTTATGTATLFNTNATTLNVGGAATTMTLGYNSTAASTTNISTGAVGATNTKTINVGTGGASGSETTVNIGSASSSNAIYVGSSGPSIVYDSSSFISSISNVNAFSSFARSTSYPRLRIFNPPHASSVSGDPAAIDLYGSDTGTSEPKTCNILPQVNNSVTSTVNIGGAISGNTLKINGTTGGTTTLSSDVTTGTVNLFSGVTTGTVNLANGGASIVEVGSTIRSSQTTANVFNTTATTVNMAGAGTTVSIGAATGTTTINNANTVVTGDLAVNGADITTTATGTATLFNTNATTLNVGGAATTATIGYTGTASSTTNISTGAVGSSNTKTVNLGTNAGLGTINVNIGSDVLGTTTINSSTLAGSSANSTQNVFNTNHTVVNAFGAATTLTMGATSGATTTIRGGTLVGNTTTQNVFNATATTVNAFGAGTTVSIGAATGTTTINNANTVVTGDLAVNGANIITTSTGTATLFNTNATTLNVGGAATTMTVGSSTATINLGSGTTGATINIKGNLVVEGTTTTVNSTTVTIDDINIVLADGVSVAASADGGGITLGTTGITWNYLHSATSWSSSQNINVATGKTYKINSVDVLTATSLGSTVTSSSLTAVGTIATGVWNGTAIGVAYGGTGLTTYTTGQIVYASGSTTLAGLSASATAGAVVASTGSGSAPEYKTISVTNGSVTSGSGTLTLAIQDAAANGSTKGLAAFNSTQFDDASGVITLDTIDGGTYA